MSLILSSLNNIKLTTNFLVCVTKKYMFNKDIFEITF